MRSGSAKTTLGSPETPAPSSTCWDLTGSGPDAYVRLYATYSFNDKHALRLTVAPLETEGTGTLSEETTFQDAVFAPDVPTKGTYRFNTYRLTYRWTFHDSEHWRWGVGAAALVRDAEIALEQGDLKQSRDDLGVVPLLHLYGEYHWNDELDLILDVEGLGSTRGTGLRCRVQGALCLQRRLACIGGYRTWRAARTTTMSTPSPGCIMRCWRSGTGSD